MGTCRVEQPLLALCGDGAVTQAASGIRRSHTLHDALQFLEILNGAGVISDLALPYVFSHARMPRPDALRRAIEDGIDVFLIEVSSANQFFLGDTPIVETLVESDLVRRHGAILLGWYRQICRHGAADEACVRATLDGLREAGHQLEGAEDLLRGIRLRRLAVDDLCDCLRAMIARWGGRWLVVSPFAIPGDDGTLMRERRDLSATLAEAADRCGALFFDPSHLIGRYGRDVALAGKGVYHWAPPFMPMVGEALVGEIRAAAAPPAIMDARRSRQA